jgi:protein-disulfide isomerase
MTDKSERPQGRTASQWLNTVVNVATLGVAVYVAWTLHAAPAPAALEPAPPSQPISLRGGVVKGQITAPVVVIEYSDFQCPFCAQFARTTIQKLEERYLAPGKAVFIFRYRPLEAAHPYALSAAKAAVCADEQGEFWQMHDLLFADPMKLDAETIAGHERQLQLNSGRFENCTAAAQTVAQIRESAAGADALGLKGTPVFLIGRTVGGGMAQIDQVIGGAQPEGTFVTAIDAIEHRAAPKT